MAKILVPDKAASFVVNLKAGRGDYVSIQKAIDALPVGVGGTLFIGPGTFVGSLTVPANTPIKFIGSGRKVTLINIGAGTFTAPDNVYFESIEIASSNGTLSVGGSLSNPTSFYDSLIGSMANFNINGIGTSFVGSCIESNVAVNISASDVSFVASELINTEIFVNASNCGFNECKIDGQASRDGITLAAGFKFLRIVGCRFLQHVNQSIDMQGTDSIVIGCNFDKVAAPAVVESGAADRNLYIGNTEFGGSTIIGTASMVDGENFRNVKTWGATGDGVTDDTAAIQSAIDALPSAGGVLYLPEGEYDISTTLTLPATKPVKVVGAGRRSTVINLGTNVIAAFTFSGQFEKSFSDFSVKGSPVTAGQIIWSVGTTPSNAFVIPVERVDSDFDFQIETIVLVAGGGGPRFHFNDCRIFLPDRAASRLWTGAGGSLRMTNCVFTTSGTSNGGGGISNNPNVDAYASVVSVQGNCSVGTDSQFLACDLQGGVVTFNGVDSALVNCRLQLGTIVRRVDIAAGAVRARITGCIFTGGTSESIRTASDDGYFAGNNAIGALPEVTEIGAANDNRFYDIDLVTSTVIGADSTINGIKNVSRSAVATVDAFAFIFRHVNPKGIPSGLGTVKNTGGANGLNVRETAIDLFGVTSTRTTLVPFGDELEINTDDDVGTAFPPYKSYQIEIQSAVAGNSTTFDLQFSSSGAQ